MKQIQSFLKNINPLQKSKSNSVIEHTIQKVLAFALIYCVSSLVMEIVIIAAYSLFGYDVLRGVLPSGDWVGSIPLLGMCGFLMVTILYIRLVEKSSLSQRGMGLNQALIKTFFKGTLFGGILIVVIAFILVITRQYKFEGIYTASGVSQALWLCAFLMQSSAEEVMCRGFLQSSLQQRMRPGAAIFISSLVFMAPHLPTVFQIGGFIAIIAIINLLLVSVLFSLSYLYEKSVGIACGIHFGWNFCLGSLLGLNVSGGDASGGVVHFSIESSHNWLTGGQYGIEASLIATPVLLLCVLLYSQGLKGKQNNDFRKKAV